MKTIMLRMVALLCFCPFVIKGQSPGTINIQGVLTQSSGQPIPDGQYLLTFRIYSSALGDVVLWEEKQENTQVQNGVFSTILGKINPLNLSFDKPYFLGIRTGQEPEMAPRIEMTSTPYSLMAKNVENNSISSEKIQANAVTIDKISSPLISSLNGVTNDGGNINIVAGANITILSNDQDNTITISAVNPGTGTSGISRINPGKSISVTGQDGPTATISVSPNSITEAEIQNNTITTDKIVPNVLSSLSGVSNDGGNINLVAGNNISIVPNDANKTITISATGTGGGGTGSISQLLEGNGIGIQNPLGPNTTIGLKPNILLGPAGSLFLLNQNSVAVAGISANTTNLGGSLSLSNSQGMQTFGVTHFTDGQPLLSLNSRLGRQVVDIKANEFSDGEINLKSVLTNTTLRLGSNDNAGGLVHVFNRVGTIVSQLGVNARGDGLLKLNSVNNRLAMELESVSDGSGVLRLFNNEGTLALRLTTAESLGGRLVINNRSGNEAVSVSTNNSGDGGLFLRSGQDRPMIQMLSNPDNGGGMFSVFNQEGNQTIRLSNFIDRQPFLILRNRLGDVASEFIVNEFSDGELTLRSVLRNPTLRLTANEDAGGLINVFNPNGSLAALLRGNGSGYFTIFNRDEIEMIQLGIKEDQNALISVSNRLGNNVADLESNDFSDGSLTLRSVLNNPTVRLTASEDAGGLINVFNRRSDIAINLTTDLDGDGEIYLNSGSNVGVLHFTTNANGGGYIGLNNQEETEVFRFTTQENRQPSFQVKSRLGRTVAELEATDFSDGALSLYSVLENPTVLAAANDNAGGLITVLHKGGTPSAIMSEQNGYGAVGVLNPEAVPLAAMEGNETTGFGSFVVFGNDGTSKMVEITRDVTSLGGKLAIFNKNNINVANLLSNIDDNGLLQLKNKLDNISGGFLAAETGGTLFLNDGTANLNPRAILENTPDGANFLLYNNSSNLIHRLSSKPDGAGLLEIKSSLKPGENVVEMGGTEDSEGYLYLMNRDQKTAVYLSAAAGDGALSLSDIAGRHMAGLDGSRYGGSLSLSNADEKPVHYMGSNGKTMEGFYSIFSKTDINKNRLQMGGDSLGNGYLNLFNLDGLNTFFMGHNQFKDGMISLKNNMGNLGVLLESLRDGGNVTVTDGKPGTNHRAVLLNALTGGKLSLFNNQTRLVSTMGVGDNGEGLWQIINKNDLTKNRVEVGGDNSGAGFAKFYNNNTQKTAEIGTIPDMAGFISTYSSLGKRQTYISPSGGDGGAVSVMNNTENIVGTLGYDGYGGTVFVTNKDNKGGAVMTHNTRGGRIFGQNMAGKTIGELTTTADQAGEVNIFNANGINTSKLGHTANGSGQLEVGTPNGNKVVRVTGSDGSGFIGVDNVDNQEVVRITANTGKGGGIALRNDKVIDMIALTQTQSNGTILVNNSTGGLMATMTRNPNTGSGKIAVNGPNGNELASMTGTTQSTGLVNVFNSTGGTLAGIASNNSTGGGNLFANNSSGKEVARLTTNAAGTGVISIDNNSGINLAGMASNTLTGGGYIYANNSSGQEIARIANFSSGDGYVSVSNTNAAQVAYLSQTTMKGGYIGVTSPTGGERARLFATSNGGGYMNVFNPSGTDVARLAFGGTNNGLIQTSNSAGSTIATMGSTATNQGFMAVNSNTGVERAYIMGQDFGGEIGVRDPNGNRRTWIAGSGSLTVSDQDGSYFNASAFGKGVQLFFVDALQHPRMEIGAGFVSSKGPNGGESSFLSNLAGSQNLGFVGVRNSNVFEGPTEAGIYVNSSGQGVIFADVKNFKMDYPGKPGKQIWYGSLEGPELAAYIRGTGKLINGRASIEFTDHYQKVANTGTMTVILTPLSGKSKGLAVVGKKSTGFEVEELLEGTGNYEFDWEVKCVRIGYEDFEVVRATKDDPQPLQTGQGYPGLLESGRVPKSALEAAPEKAIRQSDSRVNQ